MYSITLWVILETVKHLEGEQIVFEQTDKLVDRFYKDSEDFVKKLRTKHIPVKVIKSEYPLGTQNGTNYHVYPSEER